MMYLAGLVALAAAAFLFWERDRKAAAAKVLYVPPAIDSVTFPKMLADAGPSMPMAGTLTAAPGGFILG